MGRWFARFLLQEGFKVIISGRDKGRLAAAKKELGVPAVTNQEILKSADIILISVSIDSFTEVVKEISPRVSPEQIIVDITSLKQAPVKAMHQFLKGPTILGTHPLFGPGARDLANQNFILTPTNAKERQLSQKVAGYLKNKGARVILMTPKKHDQMMSVVLGLAHFISIVAADTLAEIGKLPELKAVGGSTFRVLTTLVESVISEDPDLYATLQMRLPYVTEVESLFQNKTASWAELVKNQDKETFAKNMAVLKRKFTRNNASFGQAYENIYKIMEWL
jgi:prephenate dehydrogenase